MSRSTASKADKTNFQDYVMDFTAYAEKARPQEEEGPGFFEKLGNSGMAFIIFTFVVEDLGLYI